MRIPGEPVYAEALWEEIHASRLDGDEIQVHELPLRVEHVEDAISRVAPIATETMREVRKGGRAPGKKRPALVAEQLLLQVLAVSSITSGVLRKLTEDPRVDQGIRFYILNFLEHPCGNINDPDVLLRFLDALKLSHAIRASVSEALA